MPTLVHKRIQAAQKGSNKTAIYRAPSGWVVLGDQQFIRGYTLLLSDPIVTDINALTGSKRMQFLRDMTVIGDVLLSITDAFRINYEILGNSDPVLHAHIFPRYMSEPEAKRAYPVWLSYTNEELSSRPFDYERDRTFMTTLKEEIQKRL